MYKVFLNSTELILKSEEELLNKKIIQNTYVELGGIPELTQIESWLESDLGNVIVFNSTDIDKDWSRFLSHFKVVPAAGGIVGNDNGEVLSIYRNGKWDLPKGKLEKNENIRQCAIREVKEETNAEVISCSDEVYKITYHVYPHKGKMVIKPTYWFLMLSKSENFIPQLNEGIERVEWYSHRSVVAEFKGRTFKSIEDLLFDYFN
ncbi:MAG: NUDIX hydrolase [Salibacteraceae bacterium]